MTKRHPQAATPRERTSGVTMVQTAALVALIGSLVAVGVPTFMRTVRRSKVAEASTELERLYQATATYYVARHGSDRSRTHCVPDAAGPTPASPSADPVEIAFAAEGEAGAATWKALGFQPQGAIRYSYAFVPESIGCESRSHGAIAVLRAHGDLDGDGERSLFERRVSVDRNHDLTSGDVLLMHDRVE